MAEINIAGINYLEWCTEWLVDYNNFTCLNNNMLNVDIVYLNAAFLVLMR